jgi:DNA-binding SARP family transcriptional activator
MASALERSAGFTVLGWVTATGRNGEELAIGGARRKAVLAMLLLSPAVPVSLDRMVDVIWGEAATAVARNAAQAHVSRLRKALRHEDVAVVGRATGYHLDVDPEQVDLFRFRRLVAGARATDDPARTHDLLHEALDLWTGPPFAGTRSEKLCCHIALELEEERLTAIEEQLVAAIRMSDHARAISRLVRLVGEHPTRERMHELLMVALHQVGRQAEALDVYRNLRHRLVGQLAIEPGPRLRALHSHILRINGADTELTGWLAAGPVAGRQGG